MRLGLVEKVEIVINLTNIFHKLAVHTYKLFSFFYSYLKTFFFKLLYS